MSGLIWPDWVEIAVGGLGLAWGLAILARLRDRPPRGPNDPAQAWGLIVLGAGLVIVGGLRFSGLMAPL